MDITLDIETIPAQKPGFLIELREKHLESAEKEAADVSPPKNYKSQEAIDKWWAETGSYTRQSILMGAEATAMAEYRQTSLDGAFGQIAVIGYAIGNRDPLALWSEDYANQEAKIIRGFYEAITSRGFYEAITGGPDSYKPVRFVGHNILGFDLRFLFQRSIINGIKPPSSIPFNAKPWEQDKVFDTMTAWAGVGGKIKLDKLCKALGLPGKPDGIDGSKVWDFVEAGQIADVAAYCVDDVVQTRECFRRLTFAG